MNVVNVAVTQGSNKARQQGRYEELQGACNYLGFGLVQIPPAGLEGVNLKTRKGKPVEWVGKIGVVERIIREHSPRAIFFPHEHDQNSSHIGTHHLVMDALDKIGSGLEMYVVETEFWSPMRNPNLMIESSETDVARLVGAMTFHVEEVKRNPYHLTLPSWMNDNV
jgi:LmbE family N-acetylglucosaminyl deacetylase